MIVDPHFSKHMWRHSLCLNIINTAKIMHLGQSSACNQDYENLVSLIFLNKWSMYRWLEIYSDMVLLCSCFLTHQFFPPYKCDWFQILSVSLVAKKSAKLWLLISKLCSSSFRDKISCQGIVIASFKRILMTYSIGSYCWPHVIIKEKVTEDLEKAKSK